MGKAMLRATCMQSPKAAEMDKSHAPPDRGSQPAEGASQC